MPAADSIFKKFDQTIRIWKGLFTTLPVYSFINYPEYEKVHFVVYGSGYGFFLPACLFPIED
jgi:hypothetical protein